MKAGLIWCLVSIFVKGWVVAQEGQTIYTTYCAGCHGTQLDGNSAAKLIKTEWIYGRGRGHLVRNITFGIPTTEMAAWNQILNPEEINSVVDFIIEAQEISPNVIRPIPDRITTSDYILEVEKLVTDGLNNPWGIEFVDSSRALISEKTGSIRWLIDGEMDPQPIRGTPQTHSQSGTGGYMDIALDPAYEENGWIYLAFSHTNGDATDPDAQALTKIIRSKIRGYEWMEEQTLFEVPDSLMVVGGNRWGCRFLFDDAGFLYFTIGDMGRAMDSQDLARATGKVFRINPDGSIPADNPFAGQEGALAAIYSIGIRNVQGITQHPETGVIWMTEHGPMGGDELNILKKGANYGWPVITYGVDYTGEIVSNKTHQTGMEQPLFQWTPSIAVCPAEFCSSPLFPNWNGNLLIGSLAFEDLRRLEVQGEKVIEEETILRGFGRIREIKTGPEGAFYVLFNKPDMIVRITPE